MGESANYLLLGGGIASVAAAQAIRERDKEGSVILATANTLMPYDRPPLSKNYLTNKEMTADDAASKFDNFYPDNNIDLRRGVNATSLSLSDRSVTFGDGNVVKFDKLLIATGSRPAMVDNTPASDERVHVFRTIEDADAIRKEASISSAATVVGSGFLGMELAASLSSLGLKVNLLSKDPYPWGLFASAALGKFMLDYYTKEGVDIRTRTKISAFSHGRAVTMDNQIFPVDFAVVAVGVRLNTEIAKNAGLNIAPEGGIETDEFLETKEKGIFAAGDVAFFKDLTMNKLWHLEHHLNAQWQGRCVGANMAGDRQAYDRVPYFFSDFFDLHMILRGDTGAPKSNTRVIGDMDSGEFIELYGDGSDVLRTGIAISREEKSLDPISDKLEELIRAKAKIGEIGADAFRAPAG